MCPGPMKQVLYQVLVQNPPPIEATKTQIESPPNALSRNKKGGERTATIWASIASYSIVAVDANGVLNDDSGSF